LARLASEGRWVVYELQQDDPIVVDLCIGDPLNEAEIQQGRLQPPQRSPICLPSGTLCIEGYASLQCSPDRDPGKVGGTIEVPAGDYVLSLYRTDWDALDREGASEHWKGPHELIVLTPACDVEGVSNPAAILRIPQTGHEPEAWIRSYEIKGSVFEGLVRFWADADVFEINIDPAAAQILGITAGAALSIRVANLSLHLRAVFLGEDIASAQRVRAALGPGADRIWQAQWMLSDVPSEDRLCFESQRGALDIPVTDRGAWIPAVVAVATG